MAKWLVKTLLGVAVGFGVYGLYVNYGTRAAMTQVTAKKLLDQCAVLRAEQYPNPEEIDEWLFAAQEAAPEVFAVNAVLDGALNSEGQGSSMAIQVNSELRDCSAILRKKLPHPAANN